MKTIKIKGMSCQHCTKSVKEALEKIDGISRAEVNLERGEAAYEGEVPPQVLAAAIEAIGFEVV
ncbi:MAG: hypothetical protein CSB24_04000 [Deltaproteobacteria bacterium]|nr:MAG: hypothetical protein CSB24_04000 [Deltaproteobacteria bacterium]